MTDREFALELGRKARAARNAAGLTLDDAAACCGVGRSTLCDVEGAVHVNLYVSTIRRIARGLAVPISSLMPEEGD